MAKDPYHLHVAKHVRGSRNPRVALGEAARSWGGGVESNPKSQTDDVVKLALLGVAAFVGISWLHKRSVAQQAAAITAGTTGTAGCSCGCDGDQRVHTMGNAMTSAV